MSGNADAVRQLHAGEAGTLRRDVLYDLLVEDVTWSAIGPRDLFPWSGSVCGHDGVRAWFAVLNEKMAYESFDLRELYEDEDTVIEIVSASGTAVATGRPFASEVVRVWTFRDGKAVRVRSYYDTYAYATALVP